MAAKSEEREPVVPDLLYCEPTARVDVGALEDGLSFAFVSGDSSGVIDKALDGMKVGPSDWNPEIYESDLFLDELITQCMKVGYGGRRAPLNHAYLKRVLSLPPRERADVELRREALEELWRSEQARKGVETAYLKLCRILHLFDTQAYSSRYDDLERRVELVRLIRELIREIAEAPEAKSRAVERIREFGLWVTAGEAYQRLAEFVDYEGNLASVDLGLRIGVDGKIRGFEVLRVEENKGNRFYQSPLRRLFSRIVLFLRGFRFSETEITERWIDKIFTAALEFVPLLFQLKADLEFYLAALAFREYCEERELEVCLPELAGEQAGGEEIYWRGLFNPLLFAQEIMPVCCDIQAEGGGSMLVITGPNSGGKTRLLQAVALVQLLGQAGAYVPAAAARLRYTSGMFVSLVEGVKVDQAEGRLGTELLRIRRMFEQSAKVSLVIIDELCSGTNPKEGEEIFHLVMSLLQRLEPLVLITTHFLDFAKRLESGNGLALEFLQVELGAENQPTYGFVPGVAETSLASLTAARLGVTREELTALIEENAEGG